MRLDDGRRSAGRAGCVAAYTARVRQRPTSLPTRLTSSSPGSSSTLRSPSDPRSRSDVSVSSGWRYAPLQPSSSDYETGFPSRLLFESRQPLRRLVRLGRRQWRAHRSRCGCGDVVYDDRSVGLSRYVGRKEGEERIGWRRCACEGERGQECSSGRTGRGG
jgi:hypothetical protein